MRPIRKRSGADAPLTSRPPVRPSVSNATTPSIVLTKFDRMVGRSARKRDRQVGAVSLGEVRRQRPAADAALGRGSVVEPLDPPVLIGCGPRVGSR